MQTLFITTRTILVTLVAAAGLSAQMTTSSMLGTVQDASGKVVNEASIKTRNLDTNDSRETATFADGRFRVPLLPPGSYEITVTAKGFSKHVRGPIVLRLGQDAELELTLEVAGVTETLTVTDDATILNTTNAEVGTNFDSKRISELPMAPNRNILSMALQIPGVSQLSSGNTTFAQGGVTFSVNGMRTRSNNFMIDGQDSVQPNAGGLVHEIHNPDLVAEFRVVTNQFLPEYGRTAGSVVSVLTRSGSNRFHGTAFWMYNGNVLNARSNLDKRTFVRAPWRVQNQAGGTVGGPIIKDKTFFFASGLSWTDRLFASGTAITGAPTTEGQAVLRNAVGSLPQMKALLEHLPAAQNATGNTARFSYRGTAFVVPLGTLAGAASNTRDEWQWSGRADHTFNENHRLMARLMYSDRLTIAGQSSPPGLSTTTPAGRTGAAVALNSTAGASRFNELRLGFQRLDAVGSGADPKAITIPSIEVSELGLTGFNAAVSRTAIGLAANLPSTLITNNYQLADNFGLLSGRHMMKFGVDFRRQNQFVEFNPVIRGRLSYASLQDLVDDAGAVATINALLPGVGKTQYYAYYDFAFFMQDQWRVKPNFTLLYGFRYETPGNPAEWYSQVSRAVVANNNGDPRYLYTPVPPRDMNNWAPRFGFNFRPGKRESGPLGFIIGEGQLIIRGGYSRTYDLIFNNIYSNIYSSFPFTQVASLPARTPGSWAFVYGIGFEGRPLPAVDPLTETRTIVGSDFRSPVAEQLGFQIQRELSSNWALTAGWIATKGTALFQTIDDNPTVPGTNGLRRLDNARGIQRLRANAASSIYHSLQTSVEKRLSRNFSMAAHHTWSAFLDDASDIFNPSVAGEVAIAQDSYNRRADRGRSTYDRPHRFSVNGVYELPWRRDQRGLLGRAAGGWQISGFLTFQSGAPFSPLSGNVDPGFRLTGIDTLVGNAIRPRLNTSLDLSSMTLDEIVAAGGRTLFRQVTAANPLGNAGRNILRADGINNFDVAVLKNFMVSESNQLQFRFEMYNSTNTRDYGIPQAAINNAGFGLSGNTDGGNRRIVMGLRYIF